MQDELEIGKTLEESKEKEEAVQLATALDESNEGGKESKYILIFALVVIGIFVFSFAGFKVYNNLNSAQVLDIDQLHKDNLDGELPEDQGYIYNGFSVIKADGLWWTEVKRYDTLVKVPLHYGPKEVEGIPLKGSLSANFDKGDLFIAVNPSINYNKYYTLSLMELNNNIVQGINRGIVSACTQADEVCENRTIINCENNSGRAVLELVVDSKSGIEFSGSCIKVSGSEQNLTKAVDRLLYHWYGIMN